METIKLHLDQDNELRFKVTVEGSEKGSPNYRLMLESDRMSLSFPGTATEDGEISVIVPSLKKTLGEGNYNAQLEVTIDDRLFVPLKLVTYLQESVKVTAESVTRSAPIKASVATATLVETKVKSRTKASIPEKKATNTSSEKRQPKRSSKPRRNIDESEMRSLIRKMLADKK
jgi:hypothetical protein